MDEFTRVPNNAKKIVMRFSRRTGHTDRESVVINDIESNFNKLVIYEDCFETVLDFETFAQYVVDALNEKHERDNKESA